MQAITRLDFEKIFKDTSGGACFYLDDRDRVVLADSRQHVLRIAHGQKADGSWEFTVEDDWDGRIWWVTRLGRVGTVDPATGTLRAIRLDEEEIQNSFSVAEDGVSIVTDHARPLRQP